jgi:ornithine cyclodeaminase/alanine dehydrogenase-like protein (mu-crystallin family)
MPPLLLSEEDVCSVLTMEENLQALESAYRQEAIGAASYRPKATVYVGSERGGAMTHVTSLGGLRNPPVVVINIRSMVQRTSEDRDIHKLAGPGGTYMSMLFSGETGELLAMMANGEVSWYRHAGTAGLAAREMALPDAKVAGILGSGSTARAHALAYACVRRLELFKVYSPSLEHRKVLAEWLKMKTGVRTEALDNPEAVVRGSQIVAACTSRRFEPLVKKDWLEPGVHYTGVQTGEGGVELEPEGLKLFHRLVSSFDSASTHHFTEPGHSPLRTAITEENLDAFGVIPHHHTIADVLSGKAPGRESPGERNYFVNNGTGVQYAATAALVYQKAKERGVGTKMPEPWFRWFQR